jgi:catechol-2,3-dioxygenase
MITPSEADFSGPLGGDIEQYLATDNSSARDRVRLFRLAWDVAGSSFGSRQVLYERFFASDPLTRARALAAIYPKNEAMERVLDFLRRDEPMEESVQGGREMSYRPKHLGHVNIYVRNAERSRQWYEEVLGLHTYDFRPGWAAFMSADTDKSHEVALMQVGDDAPLQQRGQVGLNHLAFMMESLDDLKDAYLRLKEKGVKIDRVMDHGLSLGIYFRDPDGNGLEVSYELPREKWPRQERVFASDVVDLGLFPGPWDEEIARQRALATAS